MMDDALKAALDYIAELEAALDVANVTIDKLVEEVAAFEFELPGEAPVEPIVYH